MRALKFIRGHVIFKLRYNEIYQMKPPQVDIKMLSNVLKDSLLYSYTLETYRDL